MKVYIAAPFFNEVQTNIVKTIENLCTVNELHFYSPRLHSSSADIPPERRRDPEVWKPVIDSNIRELRVCDFVLAVLEYAMPDGVWLGAVWNSVPAGYAYGTNGKRIELPDNGVVFECGYAKAIGTPVVGFHSKKQLAEMNLMLTHTMAGFVTGFDELSEFIAAINLSYYSLATKIRAYTKHYHGEVI